MVRKAAIALLVSTALVRTTLLPNAQVFSSTLKTSDPRESSLSRRTARSTAKSRMPQATPPARRLAQENSLPAVKPAKQQGAAAKRTPAAKKRLLSPVKRPTPAPAQRKTSTVKRAGQKGRLRLLGKFTVVAYSLKRRNGKLRKHTASGTTPKVGRTVAVDPRVIPLGSRIHITGLGERIAEDTGGKIKGKKLDLLLPSVEQCLQFGVQKREVHLIVE